MKSLNSFFILVIALITHASAIAQSDSLSSSHKTGKVLIKFVIEKDGTITNIEVTKSLSPSIETLKLFEL